MIRILPMHSVISVYFARMHLNLCNPCPFHWMNILDGKTLKKKNCRSGNKFKCYFDSFAVIFSHCFICIEFQIFPCLKCKLSEERGKEAICDGNIFCKPYNFYNVVPPSQSINTLAYQTSLLIKFLMLRNITGKRKHKTCSKFVECCFDNANKKKESFVEQQKLRWAGSTQDEKMFCLIVFQAKWTILFITVTLKMFTWDM